MRLSEKYPWIGDFDKCIPDGWQKAFGDSLCREIQEEYDKMPDSAKESFRVVDVKEKFGTLRIYISGDWTYCDKIQDIIYKYERISGDTCILCGDKATRFTLGWITPVCDKCTEENNLRTEAFLDNESSED